MKLKTLLCSLISLFIVNCAGPVTPFGGLTWNTKKVSKTFIKNDKQRVKIEFIPSRQNLHQLNKFQVIIKLPKDVSQRDEFKINYNGLDMTEKYFQLVNKKIFNNNRTVVYTFKDLSLPASQKHEISVSYYHEATKSLESRHYLSPKCEFFDMAKVKKTHPFQPPKHYLNLIEGIAHQKKMNPALLTGLVAQESGFNKNAVSWSKAIGLTQMTPLADRQIASAYQDWPRNTKASNASVPLIKSLILTGVINSKNEWRLNPKQSLEGGVSYIEYLQKYWSKPDNKKIVDGLENTSVTDVILASYNSGAFRVKSSIKKNKNNWLNSKNLNEAKKYVRRIKSYCDHFSFEKEVFYE